MTGDLAKDYLHRQLRSTRQALVWKLDGLSAYDVRRPLIATRTNVATLEARYFGEVFDRPFPEPLGRWQDADGGDLWVTPEETRERVSGFCQRSCEHADATINERPMDAPGHVPWWSRTDANLFTVMVHVLQETTRHVGHADSRPVVTAEYEQGIDTAAREAYRATIERAEQDAAGGSYHADLSDTHGAGHCAVRSLDLVEARR